MIVVICREDHYIDTGPVIYCNITFFIKYQYEPKTGMYRLLVSVHHYIVPYLMWSHYYQHHVVLVMGILSSLPHVTFVQRVVGLLYKELLKYIFENVSLLMHFTIDPHCNENGHISNFEGWVSSWYNKVSTFASPIVMDFWVNLVVTTFLCYQDSRFFYKQWCKF